MYRSWKDLVSCLSTSLDFHSEQIKARPVPWKKLWEMRDKKAKPKHFSSAYWFSLPRDLLVPAGAHQRCQPAAVPSCQPLPPSLSDLLLLHLWPWMTRSWQTEPAAPRRANPKLLSWESWSTAHVFAGCHIALFSSLCFWHLRYSEGHFSLSQQGSSPWMLLS